MLGLNNGLAQYNNTRPLNAAAAPLVILPQAAVEVVVHLPGKYLIAESKSLAICAKQAEVLSLGSKAESLAALPTPSSAVNTSGTPP